jgi:hypothetical protein
VKTKIRLTCRPLIPFVMTALVCHLSGTALAQGGPSAAPTGSAAPSQPTAQDRDNARTMLFEGRKKMAAGEHAEALKLFRAAHAIMNVPTTGLDLARAQEALRQLIEARETALDVAKLPVVAGESAVFGQARIDAAALAANLNTRIPSLVITVSGPSAGAEVVVSLDGAVLPAATVGLPRRVNPGKRVVEVKAAGFVTERREVEVKEGEVRTEPVMLRPPGAAAAGTEGRQEGSKDTTRNQASKGQPPGQPIAGPGPGELAAREPSAPGKSIPIWAWVSGGVGVAAAGLSVGFLVDHLDARATVARECPENTCDQNIHDQASVDALVARWERSIGLSVAFGAVFLTGAGMAITGIVKGSAGQKSPTGLAAVPWAGPDGGGLLWKGAF